MQQDTYLISTSILIWIVMINLNLVLTNILNY
jgi:hypothetical protein